MSSLASVRDIFSDRRRKGTCMSTQSFRDKTSSVMKSMIRVIVRMVVEVKVEAQMNPMPR